LSGEGARLHGGRWNHAGTPIVYTSQSLSLAVLEYLVNVSIVDLPDDLVYVEIDVPNKIKRTNVRFKDLPENWRTFPGSEELKDIGTEWASRGSTLVLVVPSVVIPSEHNYLFNPKHRLIDRIKVLSVEPFALDPRLREDSSKEK
jgi:RES domain-containing protein